MKKLDIFGYISPYPEDINQKMVRKFLNSLKKNEEFEVYINSPGGDVFEGLGIYNLLAEYKPLIKIIGQASSMASVISCAGSKVFIADNAVMLIHKPWTMGIGNEDDLKKVTDNLEVAKNSIITTYKTKTGLSNEELDDLMSEEKFHDANKCLELNLVDKIYMPTEEENKTAGKIQSKYQYDMIMNMNYRKINNILTNKDNTMTVTVDSLQADIKILDSQKSDIQDKLKNLETEIKTKDDKIQGYEFDNGEMKNKITNLEIDLTKSNTELIESKAKNEELENTNFEAEINVFIEANKEKILPNELELTKKRLLAFKNSAPEMYKEEVDSIQAREKLAVLDGSATDGNTAKPPADDNRKISEMDMLNEVDQKVIIARVKAYINENKLKCTFREAQEQLTEIEDTK